MFFALRIIVSLLTARWMTNSVDAPYNVIYLSIYLSLFLSKSLFVLALRIDNINLDSAQARGYQRTSVRHFTQYVDTHVVIHPQNLFWK